MTPVVASNPTADTRLLVIMGVSGSGKTSLSQALAKHYGYQYWDADDFHSDAAREHMANGQPLTDEMRAPWVLSLQQHLRNEAAHQRHCTLAFSGLKQPHRNQIRAAGLKTLFLFLDGNKPVIHSRLSARTNHFMPPDLLDSQFNSLENPTQEPDVIPIDISVPLEQVIAQAIKAIDQVPGW